jgi:hypothetical protein
MMIISWPVDAFNFRLNSSYRTLLFLFGFRAGGPSPLDVDRICLSIYLFSLFRGCLFGCFVIARKRTSNGRQTCNLNEIRPLADEDDAIGHHVVKAEGRVDRSAREEQEAAKKSLAEQANETNGGPKRRFPRPLPGAVKRKSPPEGVG